VSEIENDVRAHDGIENENEAVERAFLSRAGQIAVACLLFFPATIAAGGFYFLGLGGVGGGGMRGGGWGGRGDSLLPRGRP